MKYVLEFGIRGSKWSGEIVIPSQKLATELAASLTHVFVDCSSMTRRKAWKMDKNCTRKSWSDSDYFVAITALDGTNPGSAAAKLWRKENGDDK